MTRQIRPNNALAIAELISDMDWKEFLYVYDSEEALHRVQQLLEAPQACESSIE